jgi:hypothetical protein
MDEQYGQIPCIGRWCLMFAFVTPILEGQIKNTPIVHAITMPKMEMGEAQKPKEVGPI